jgi:DNA integrity scanning protein DisA with diadenylate cyclase activity
MFYDLNQQRSRARHLRMQLRELLDDADAGSMCLLRNAERLAVVAKELREVEDAIDDQMMAPAAGV